MRQLNRRRTMGHWEEPFSGFLVRGKFTDDSTEADWVLYKEEGIQISIVDLVDRETKQFEYRQENVPSTLGRMFSKNSMLESLDKIYAPQLIGFGGETFRNCNKLKYVDFSCLKLSSGTNISYCFQNCYFLNIIEFPNNKESLQIYSSPGYTFSGCSLIEMLDISFIDLTGKNYQNTFMNCSSLKTLKASFDFKGTTNVANMFAGCRSLENIIGSITGLSISLYIDASPLTNESAMVFINGLAEVESPQTITFSAATYATLSPEQIAIAKSKNWIVAHV